jgi:ComF family protein
MLPFITHYCSGCALSTPVNINRCGRCQKTPFHFDHAFSLLEYKSLIRPLIHQFKSNQLVNLKPLQLWLFSAYYHHLQSPLATVIVPIPSSIPSTIKRGHMPAMRLAELLSELSGLAVCAKAFTKHWITPNQKQKSKQSRQQANQFKLHAQYLPQPREGYRVLLIDDVMTTGASANEAAKKLKNAGIAAVDLLTIARTPLNH